MLSVFESSIRYIIDAVVEHIRDMRMTDVELMALCGLLLWSDC